MVGVYYDQEVGNYVDAGVSISLLIESPTLGSEIEAGGKSPASYRRRRQYLHFRLRESVGIQSAV